MKNLKALKEYIENETTSTYLKYEHYLTIITYINKSIEELETLDNRSCDNCKTKQCSIKRILLEKEEINTSYFNCNDWELK